MRHTALTIAALAACCTFAQAQTPAPSPVGTVAEVHGLVTMSFGSNVATVQPDTPVFDGARFVASSSGDAELKFKNGCDVKLKPNEWISVDSAMNCDQMLAAVHTLTETAGGGTTFARTVVPLLGSAALVGAIARLPDPKITPTPR
jgi:hypothetical protein